HRTDSLSSVLYQSRRVSDLHSFPTRRSSDLGDTGDHIIKRIAAVGDLRPRGAAKMNNRVLSGGNIRGNGRAGAIVAGVMPCYAQDRKSTRLNSSHVSISYAVFCLKKKKKT